MQLQRVASTYLKPRETCSLATATHFTLQHHFLGVVDLTNYAKTRISEKLTTNIFNIECLQFSMSLKNEFSSFLARGQLRKPRDGRQTKPTASKFKKHFFFCFLYLFMRFIFT